MSFKLLMDKDTNAKNDNAISAQLIHLRGQADSIDEFVVKNVRAQLSSLAELENLSPELRSEIHRIQEIVRRQILVIDEIQKVKLKEEFLNRELPQSEKDAALEKAIQEAKENHERELELAKLKEEYDLWKDDFLQRIKKNI